MLDYKTVVPYQFLMVPSTTVSTIRETDTGRKA